MQVAGLRRSEKPQKSLPVVLLHGDTFRELPWCVCPGICRWRHGGLAPAPPLPGQCRKPRSYRSLETLKPRREPMPPKPVRRIMSRIGPFRTNMVRACFFLVLRRWKDHHERGATGEKEGRLNRRTKFVRQVPPARNTSCPIRLPFREGRAPLCCCQALRRSIPCRKAVRLPLGPDGAIFSRMLPQGKDQQTGPGDLFKKSALKCLLVFLAVNAVRWLTFVH